MKPILRILVRKERTQGGEAFVAQCLEYDIAAQGDSLDEVKHRFFAVLKRLFEIAADKKQAPLAGIAPAPAMYWNLASKFIGVPVFPPASMPKLPAGASVPESILIAA